MNKRDIFAAVAMHAIISKIDRAPSSLQMRLDDDVQIAKRAYDIASEMLNERQGRPDSDDEGAIVRAISEGCAEIACEVENLVEQIEQMKPPMKPPMKLFDPS